MHSKDGEDKHMINKTLVKNMPNVKWKEIPPVRGPNPQGLKKPREFRKVVKEYQARRVFP
jgi:hypothetical protein